MNEAVDFNDDNNVDSVTRNQGGQFIDEGGDTFTPNLEEMALAGETDAQLLGQDTSSVHALQVNMERSGADYVQAQRSFLTNSGAREIHSDSSKLSQSGVLTLNADSVEMKQSSSVITNATDVNMEQSRIGIAIANTVQVNDSSNIGILTAGDVDVEGDVRTFLMLGGDVKAGGNMTSTLDAKTAGMAAAVFAIALVLFSRLFGRKG